LASYPNLTYPALGLTQPTSNGRSRTNEVL
jgi:hypothetical protein